MDILIVLGGRRAMYTIGEIVDIAIQVEKNGERLYRKAVEKVPNPSLIPLLQWLADEEVNHFKWFTELKHTVHTNEVDPRLDEMGRTILRGVVGDQSFSLDEVDFSSIDHVKDLLGLAIEFEKDTVLFYEMIGAFIQGGETLNQLKAIIEEERRHITILEDYVRTDVGP
jgi:rubrerythrin